VITIPFILASRWLEYTGNKKPGGNTAPSFYRKGSKPTMGYRILAGGFLACLLLSAAAFARDDVLQNVPLKWSPTSTLAEMGPLDVSGALLTTKIHVDAFTDVRQNPALVAENREKTDKVRPVTTSSDVAAFLVDHLKETLQHAGVTIVDGGADVTITGEIRQFFVTETSMYRGEVSVLLHVKNSAGKEIWTGVIGGAAERFGRSYRLDNYQEAMSDMVLQAAYNLLASPGFREALQKR
jgi:hypothetical protein